MPPLPTIRRLTPSPQDARAYVALRLEMIMTERFAFMGVPGDDAMSDPEHVRRMLESPDQAIYAAMGSDGAPGLLAVAGVYRESRIKRRHRAGIWGVYTIPRARGRGLSRALLRACIDHARTWPGVAVVGLSVSQRGTAPRRLYESLGFVEWGSEPDATRVDGEPDTEIHMQMRL